MKTSTILYILILVALIVVVCYYLYYVRTDNCDEMQEIPHTLLYEQEKTIVDLFKDISKKYGRYPALKVKKNKRWDTISYSQYFNNSSSFAERLLYYVGPHPRVAILSFNRPEWFYSHMGAMMSGGVSIGVYPTASSDNCSFIVNHSHVDLLVVEDTKQLAKLSKVRMPTVKFILMLDDLDALDKYNNLKGIKENHKNDEINDEQEKIDIFMSVKQYNKDLEIIGYQSFVDQSIGSGTTNTIIEFGQAFQDDNATIIYTSGTTGDPKGVVITHKNIIESIKSALNAVVSRSNVNIYVQETYISYLPLNHVAAQMMDIYVPLASVGIVYFAEKDALKGSLKDTMKDVRPTVFIGVPRVWEKVYEKIKEKKEDPQKIINKLFVNKIIVQEMGLDRAKLCITAAAPISAEVKSFFKDLGIELCDVYGMSETTGPISMGVPGCSKGSGVPVMDVKIDKENGEILVKGGGVFKEYYKNPKATKEAFNSRGWFKTGDTGFVDRDGTLYVTGRIKDLIVTAGGENVSPIPIEEMLMSELNKESKLFDYAVVVGDKRKFLSVLLVPSKKYDQQNSTSKMIEDAINTVNKKAPNSTSTVKKYIVLAGESFEIGECLTPTLKIRRSAIDKKYKQKIDKLYEGGD
ncbi:AMP-binding enzyme [Yasminevirus sp. GU-2018]|uniref:AMP-binding enzyme n=1 Tax=Yasminevirus sp. GU-2018 TaxID=2420051 RepID=A0A5K0U8W0_9VIRU|nr:AMP-binding enzyme [Yasminevirus sp. GU-2018]